MTAIRQANDELLKENAANDPFAAKVLQSQQAYMAKIRQWTLMSEKAYLDSTQ
jgi:TRAP-type mannitol/chloroaromatic compound transport system substrate-binding protein